MKLTTRITMGLAVCCFPAGLLLLCRTDSRTLSTTKQRNLPIAAPAPAKVQLVEAYAKLPLYFERNRGQTDRRVKFLSRGRGYTLFLTPDEAVLVLRKAASQPSLPHQFGRSERGASSETALLSPGPGKDNGMILRMKLIGANRHARVVGQDELLGKANYFIGNDPKKWHSNIPTYAKVGYQNVYAGMDLMYHGDQQQLEYDFVLRPGADPKAIAMRFAGVDKLAVDAQGDLLLHAAGEVLKQRKPLIYQEVKGMRREIAGGYALKGKQTVGFQVAAYDSSRPLVIDPVLFYSTYLGGSGEDFGFAIAVDGAGNAYVTGCTDSTNFPTTAGAFQTTAQSTGPFFFGMACNNGDAFVTKLNPTGSGLVYSTYLGGNSADLGQGIALDSTGNAYVTGFTFSTNFPTTPGAFQTSSVRASGCSSICPCWDAFVTKLNSSGSGLIYSTYLGGSGADFGKGIAVDATGNAYVAGATQSPDFPTTPGAFQTSGLGVGGFCAPGDAFVTKVNPNGTGLLYSTYLGAPNTGAGAITVDGSGNAYVTGSTSSATFPTTPGAFQTTFGGSFDAFVTKLNPLGTGLLYSTYLGGSGSDQGFGIAIDNIGDGYVTGITSSSNFPTTPGGFQTIFGGNFDAFVTKLNPLGTGLLYSTYVGGNGQDQGQGIAVDVSGNAYVAGFTNSTNFPTANPVQGNFAGGGGDAFVTKVNPTGTGLDYSTYLGGSGFDAGNGIAVDNLPNPNAYVVGQTASTNFPTTAGTFQTTFGGGSSDAFVTKIANIVLPPGATSGKVTGGGTVNVSGGIANFGFIVQAMLATGQISGDLQYVNHASGANVHSVMFTTFTISGNTATFSGTCTNNGVPCTFNVTVQDNDQPPGTDSFVISINGGMPEGGTLRDGDIEIH